MTMGKRGTKKIAGITREPNGRASRKQPDVMLRLAHQLDVDQRSVMRTAVEARNRVHGVSVELSLDQMAGSFVGRLCLAGKLTDRQHEAAVKYLVDWQDMSIAISGPRSPGAVNLNATKGASGRENVQFSVEALARWRAVCAAVQETQNTTRGCASLKASLDYCVLRDQDHPHMIVWLKAALDALASHYKIGDVHKPGKKLHHPALAG